MAKELSWKIEKRKVSALVPAEYNPRVLSDKAKADLMVSISKFGQVEPLVINTNGHLIGGHSRVKAFADLGIAEADVMVPSRKLTETEERELNVRLNKNTGEWDWRMLKDFFQIGELVDYGFDKDELSKFFDKLKDTEEDDFDADAEAAKIKKPVSEIGDIWQLGGHRILCGDCTDIESINLLMDGKKANLVFTDPPYNVGYDYRPFRGRKKVDAPPAFSDKKTHDEALKFYTATLQNLFTASTDDACIYWWFADRNAGINFEAFDTTEWHRSQVLTWIKERHIFSPGLDFHKTCEPCIFGWKKGKKHFTNRTLGNLKDSFSLVFEDYQLMLDTWYEARDKISSYVHPTQKPVRLAEKALKKSSRIGDIVLDFFGGSGSTMIGCEQLGRKSYTSEIDPVYCDVIIRRWQRHSGKVAECITRPEAVMANEV